MIVVLDVTMLFLVGDGLTLTQVSDQFHGVGADGLVGIANPWPSRVRDGVSKRCEVLFWCILYHLVDLGDF